MKIFRDSGNFGAYRPRAVTACVQNQPLMVWGCDSAHDMGDLHICEGTIDADAYVGILERCMLPSRR